MTSPLVHLYAPFARRVRALVLDSVVLILIIGCSDESRINITAALPPPLSLDMLTVTLRDRDRVVEWRGSEFSAGPETAVASSPSVQINSSGPDLEFSFRLTSGSVLLSSGTISLPRHSDFQWSVQILAMTQNPADGCFGCSESTPFPLADEVRVPERDSIWVVTSGNSISDPAIF